MSISLDSILADFGTEDLARANWRSRVAVTVWLSPEFKARYDKLQQASGRRFHKKVRELLQAAIEQAELRI